MKTQLAVAISVALLSASINAQTVITANGATVELNIPASLITQQFRNTLGTINNTKLMPEAGLGDKEYVYIIRLKDAAVANYQGHISGLAATSLALAQKDTHTSNNQRGKLNVSKAEVKAYVSYLKSKQRHFLMQAQAVTGNSIQAVTQFSYAINGISARMTQDQAIKLSELPAVLHIERERRERLQTDVSQTLIGSAQVWNGAAAAGTQAMGEGVIVGIIDTGINSDHDSFADVGQDGYDHSNPWRQGVYVGDCQTDFIDMCNDKLIGIHSYPEITNDYDDETVFGTTPPAKNGEDYAGHGSHVASTAAGNILVNVPLVDGEVGKLESDGVNTGLEFTQISGVAPHANVIAYQVCSPGNPEDTYQGCPPSAILKALDDAIKDGVDVLNFSIGSGGNPWNSSIESGFLSARNAGIFVAVAAGNTYQDIKQEPGSTIKNAPWYTSVANSTHNRDVVKSVTFNDKDYFYIPSSYLTQTATLSEVLAYAGHIDATNIEGCHSFTSKAFNNTIALIKRGGCNFSIKVNHAIAAGAKAVIVFNKDGEGNTRMSMGGLEASTVPAVFISNLDGLDMIADLTANLTLEVSINQTLNITEKEADVLSPGSLIGPNTTNDVMVPFLAAPGSDIYAAYSDQQFGHDITGTNPADFTLMSGTSMASPHVAGAAALLKSVHRHWTPDNIRSALMLTATTAQKMKKADGKTLADAFDVGSGRIRVDIAVQTGLIMDETALNYEMANPLLGGDPRTLNIPSMADSQCADICSWTRVVTATGDGLWNAQGNSITENVNITVSPTTFSLKAGESQTIIVTADVADISDNWAFAQLELTSATHPNANMPIAAKVAKRNLPSQLTIEASRDADEQNFSGFKAIDLPNLSAQVTNLALNDSFEGKVKQDSNPFSALDDLNDGTQVFNFTVNDHALYFKVMINDSNSPNLDMYVLLDKQDGSELSMVKESAYGGSNESVQLSKPVAGIYRVVIQNYQASAPDAEDSFTLKQLTLYDNDSSSDNLSLKLTGDSKDFSLNLAWDSKTKMLAGDEGMALVTLMSSNKKVANVSLPVIFKRKGDDVIMPLNDSISGNLVVGVTKTVSSKIAANNTLETRSYKLTAEIPENHKVINISHDGKLNANTISWHVEMIVGMASQDVTFDLLPLKASTDNRLILSNIVENSTAKKLEQIYSFNVTEAKVETNTNPTTDTNNTTKGGSLSWLSLLLLPLAWRRRMQS
ncbi:S8 family serine peptidase [Shewanella sp. VB17]|uniref:S8 family serine peptidase n=1 Tax=Shewanella sp. VB17 TaxID=2739432 RepID=UPI0015642CFB|nr:S8 family serine peptidase [Shewanella sp. VB17]NRD73375.1 S8 family serine peptidase [Shewanella sp. VB17]